MKKIKTSKLIEQESIASSITVAPTEKGYEVSYSLNEQRKDGTYKRKNIMVDEVIEDVELPEISNSNVKHLGYNIYKHLVKPSGFYINLYRK